MTNKYQNSRIIVKRFEAACGKQPTGENPKLGNLKKYLGSGSGSKKKFGSGRVAGTRQGLTIRQPEAREGGEIWKSYPLQWLDGVVIPTFFIKISLPFDPGLTNKDNKVEEDDHYDAVAALV